MMIPFQIRDEPFYILMQLPQDYIDALLEVVEHSARAKIVHEIITEIPDDFVRIFREAEVDETPECYVLSNAKVVPLVEDNPLLSAGDYLRLSVNLGTKPFLVHLVHFVGEVRHYHDELIADVRSQRLHFAPSLVYGSTITEVLANIKGKRRD